MKSAEFKQKKSIYDKEYRLRNLEKRRAQGRAWASARKEQKKQYDIIYRQNNKAKINARHLHKKRTDPIYKLKLLLRNRLGTAIKKNYKKGSAVTDLGCSILDFKLYIESKFKPGMSWNNWSIHGWHIDHIIPLSSFNLNDRNEFLKAVHYTNLQPLWAHENLSKSDRI